MDPPYFMNVLKLLSKSNIKLAGPLLALLVGFQILMDVKFSCPCLVGWNTAISVLIFFVPVPVAIVIILLFFKLRAQGTSGTSQVQDKCGSEWNCSTFVICLVPFVVWLCLCLIDGDYIACAATDWNGKYACDNELHPNCLNWCKPTEVNQGRNETELYNYTQIWITISKVTGYSLASVVCIVAIIFVTIDYCRSRNSTISGEQQVPEDPTIGEQQDLKDSACGVNLDPTDTTTSEGYQDLEDPSRCLGKHNPTNPTKSGAQQDSKDATTSQGQQDPINHGTVSEEHLPRSQQEPNNESCHMTDAETPTEKDAFIKQ